jgi:hypothetical protein
MAKHVEGILSREYYVPKINITFWFQNSFNRKLNATLRPVFSSPAVFVLKFFPNREDASY